MIFWQVGGAVAIVRYVFKDPAMDLRFVILGALLLTSLPQVLHASDTLSRYLVAVGSNFGGPERVSLKYAVSDAERFSEIMVRMGGIEPANRIVLDEPDRDAVEKALSGLSS